VRVPGGFEVRTLDLWKRAPYAEAVVFPDESGPLVARAATAQVARVFLDFSRFPAADRIGHRNGDTTIHWYDLHWSKEKVQVNEDVEITFRVSGKAPEIWHPDTGVVEPASYKVVNGRTVVPLRLIGNDAVFVVFRKAATATSRTVTEKKESLLATVEGPWNLAFQPNRGAPAQATFDKLASWTESADNGVKYFSGIATYTKTIQGSADWLKPGAEVWLDLGDVRNIAEVAVNGKPVAAAWRRPFRVNLTGALKAGANTLEVKVANVWVNRIIGDQQPGATKITTVQSYRADSPLLPSGVLGPVRLVSIGK